MLAVALQLGVVQLQPITVQHKYDVDLQILQGSDTLAMPLLRLAEGLEGRLMLSPVAGPSLILRTTVLTERDSGCHVIHIKVGQISMGETETVIVPPVSGRLCGVETIRMQQEPGAAGRATMVVARVRMLPVAGEPKPREP